MQINCILSAVGTHKLKSPAVLEDWEKLAGLPKKKGKTECSVDINPPYTTSRFESQATGQHHATQKLASNKYHMCIDKWVLESVLGNLQ